jgi:hypothetical protein
MTFQEIQTLLKHNSDASSWQVVSKTNGSIGYCLEDVNLRIALSSIQIGKDPHLEIDILYGATTLLSFVVPSPNKHDEKSRFDNALGLTIARMVHGKN